jgi:hypothetical protein
LTGATACLHWPTGASTRGSVRQPRYRPRPPVAQRGDDPRHLVAGDDRGPLPCPLNGQVRQYP